MHQQPRGPVCQSCGMPLAMDIGGGGTNANGSVTREYCSHCYEKGKFTLPDLTLEQMQARVGEVLAEAGVPGASAAEMVKGIAALKRWKG